VCYSYSASQVEDSGRKQQSPSFDTDRTSWRRIDQFSVNPHSQCMLYRPS